MDNKNELLPLVDENGNVIGKILRGEAHDGSKKLHPVVHLHVFNSRNELYLQKRPSWKDIQPGKWDTACGGHVDYGESVETALRREVGEELNIHDYTPTKMVSYIFDGKVEKEYVNVFATVYDGEVLPNSSELEGGRFWTIDEIKRNIGNGTFTPNFESEFTSILLPYYHNIITQRNE